MQLCRCPVCHSRIALEALVLDQATSELLALVARCDTALATALVSYLGLFRSANRDLDHARSLRLAREVLALASGNTLAQALAETVESIRSKRERGDVRPLSNHNYLKQVLGSVAGAQIDREPTVVADATTVGQRGRMPQSKTGQGLSALEALKHRD